MDRARCGELPNADVDSSGKRNVEYHSNVSNTTQGNTDVTETSVPRTNKQRERRHWAEHAEKVIMNKTEVSDVKERREMPDT
jgi:hypothetical protein